MSLNLQCQERTSMIMTFCRITTNYRLVLQILQKLEIPISAVIFKPHNHYQFESENNTKL